MAFEDFDNFELRIFGGLSGTFKFAKYIISFFSRRCSRMAC